MTSFRKCPSCRALLTEEQLASTGGTCPYCNEKVPVANKTSVAADDEFEDPYAPPIAETGHRLESLSVPPQLGGKIALAGVILVEQLPLFAALVLTVWIPGNLLLEMVEAAGPAGPNPPAALTAMTLRSLVEIFFSPIYAAGIVTALAARMAGERTSYGDAMRAGLHHWGRLFGAQLVARILITLGLLCFIVPGVFLGIRYMFVNEVVVLEGAGVVDSRWRSTMLTRGREWALFQAGAFSIGIVILTGLTIGATLQVTGIQELPAAAVAGQCLVYVVSAYSFCLVFLFYWEARQVESRRQEVLPAEEPQETMDNWPSAQ